MEALNGNDLMAVEKDSGFMHSAREGATTNGVHALNEESMGFEEISVNMGRIWSLK